MDLCSAFVVPCTTGLASNGRLEFGAKIPCKYDAKLCRVPFSSRPFWVGIHERRFKFYGPARDGVHVDILADAASRPPTRSARQTTTASGRGPSSSTRGGPSQPPPSAPPPGRVKLSVGTVRSGANARASASARRKRMVEEEKERQEAESLARSTGEDGEDDGDEKEPTEEDRQAAADALTAITSIMERQKEVPLMGDTRFLLGDYVVHREHGIGQLKNMCRLVRDGVPQDCYVIAFDDGDVVVPFYQAEVLTMYRSAAAAESSKSRAPTLSKLNNPEKWQRTIRGAERAVKKVALNLLALYRARMTKTRPRYPPDSDLQAQFEARFAYEATADQVRAFNDVRNDMVDRDAPMDRLICGDVGFGKTEVALRAMFRAAMSGRQVAFLAPTTVLAQQQCRTIQDRCAEFGVRVALLTRFQNAKQSADIKAKMASGELDVVVGTHALLGNGVEFKQIGLLVIDEEQRFGVEQKEKIKAMFEEVDVLTLSATPIPRTLNMALIGVRDMSLMLTPPVSRCPIQTHVLPFDGNTMYEAIRVELAREGQVFYVRPRIEGIAKCATEIARAFPEARVIVAHGQMSNLEDIMMDFAAGNHDILVCTTIIESGLDIARVNTILVEDSDYFGLSQLYQLRGRVGRSDTEAQAYLFYDARKKLSGDASLRLRSLQEFSQLGAGYHLANRDMEIRGIGNLLGTEQSGDMARVGAERFQEMLAEYLDRIQSVRLHPVPDAKIDLGFDAFFPTSYVQNSTDRKRLRAVLDATDKPEDIKKLGKLIAKKYGELPEEAQNLLTLAEAKLYCKRIGVPRVFYSGAHIVLDSVMNRAAFQLLFDELPEDQQQRFRLTFTQNFRRIVLNDVGQLEPNQQLGVLVAYLDSFHDTVCKAAINTQ